MNTERKTLFQRPGDQRLKRATETSEAISEGSMTGDDYQKLLRSELLGVLVMVLVIAAGFTAIFLTNRNNGWISRESQKVVRQFIRNY